MKKRFILSISVIALALGSCTEEPFSKEEGNEITIEAVMAENDATRTVIQDSGTSVLWEAGDEIKVFYDGTGSRFTNQFTEPSGTAKFSGSLNVVFASNEGFSDSTPLWGLYPYRADAAADNSSVTTTLPAEQTGRAGSFAKGTNITLGKSFGLNMGFYNVCGGIRFSLTQEGVKEVVFEGLNNEDIAGKIKLAFVDGVPAVQEVIDGQKSIILSAPYGTTFETGKWYYIVALPGTLSNGFKMTFNTETQYATLKSSGSKTIKRGIFGSLADADEDLVYKDKEGGEPVTGNIVFADPAAKYACVAKFDTDGDGEVSIEEAEAATTFNGLFNDWKGVVSFDEIRYFKNVHSLSGVFNGCNKLVSLTVPENITDLGTDAFSGCSSLTSVVLPSEITRIGKNSFKDCSQLQSISIPSKVTSIESYAFCNCHQLASIDLPSGLTSISDYSFQSCSSLTSIDLPSTITTIKSYAFSRCSSLKQISIPDGVTTLGGSAFSGCGSLKSASLPSGITKIPSYCFESCSSLTSVAIPTSITSIGDYAFKDVTMWTIELPSSVSSLGNACFGRIVCVLLPSTSPVSIQSNTFSYTKVIYVPAELIGMYGAMTNWANNASKLRPISSFKPINHVSSGAADMGCSVKWAAYNVGATKPEEQGNHYAWGEIKNKSKYEWSNYFDCRTVSGPTFIKYFNGEGGKTRLDLEDDVANVQWGGNWRMPTQDEWNELVEKCIWISAQRGLNVFSPETGNVIFLPSAGNWFGTSAHNGSWGMYWSSSLSSASDSCTAYFLEFYNRGTDLYDSDLIVRYIERYEGLSIRPVCD